VALAREYSPYTGQLRCEWKAFAQVVGMTWPTTAGTIAGVAGASYEGGKLMGCADQVSGTTYTNTRLRRGSWSSSTRSASPSRRPSAIRRTSASAWASRTPASAIWLGAFDENLQWIAP
jgi:hypothetical protein